MAVSRDPTTRQYLVLGPVEARLDTRALPVASGKQTVLLAALLARPGRSVPTASLAETLWAQPPRGAAGTLRALISKLRRALTDGYVNGGAAGDDLLVAAAGGYRLRLSLTDAHGGARDVLDAQTFSSLLARARAARVAGEAATAVDAYRVALGLWRGPAFAGTTGGDGVGTLITGEARRLESERIAAVEEWLAVELELGRHAEVLGELEAVVTAAPLRERPHELLMVALYRAGRQQDALAAYRRLRGLLAEELGVEPTPRVRMLHERLLQQDPTLDAGALASPRAPAGTSWLRRAPASASFGLVPASVGNGSAAAETADLPPVGNLPVVLDALVGRDGLLTKIASLVTTSRLVTLAGTGGVGKTRLATSAAAAAALTARDDEPDKARFPDGAWCVDLAAVSSSANVAEAVSTILGVEPRQGLATLDRLVQHLGVRRLLLVLDNCEHVIEAAADVVDAVGRGCAHVAVLATSREPLGVAGEHVELVPPLDVPAPSSVDPDDVRRAAAVALFLTRARAAAPAFALTDGNAAAVTEICRRLDGLPLALELAAARMRSMTAPEVASRLEQRFGLLQGGQRTSAARHRSLRGAIDWSYELLDDDERHVFDRLSVFAGGFTLQAAERLVAGGEARTNHPRPARDLLDEVAVAGVLAGLVDKSMVVAAPGRASTRYRLLETLRSYGRERLAAHGEEQAARRAHAAYLTAFVEDAAQRLSGPAGSAAGAAIARELDDLRAAHAWALEQAPDVAVRLVAAMFRFVEHRMPPEVPLWAQRTVEVADSPPAERHPLLPTVYAVAARGAARRGDLKRARTLAERGAACAGGDDPARRHPLYACGVIALFEGRLAEAGRLTTEVHRLAQAAGDAWLVVRALVIRGLAHLYGGDRVAALAMAENARGVADPAGDPAARGWSRYISGEALLEVDPEQAAPLLDEALAAARTADDRYLAGVTMVSATSVRARHGDPRQAASLFRDVIEHWHVVGNWTQQWTTVRNIVELLIRAGLDEPAAVLLGATQSSGTAPPAFGVTAVRIARARDDLDIRLGTSTVLHAIRRGAAMSDEQALRLAHDTLDQLAHPNPAARIGA